MNEYVPVEAVVMFDETFWKSTLVDGLAGVVETMGGLKNGVNTSSVPAPKSINLAVGVAKVNVFVFVVDGVEPTGFVATNEEVFCWGNGKVTVGNVEVGGNSSASLHSSDGVERSSTNAR